VLFHPHATPSTRPITAYRIRIRYAVIGLVLGVAWGWNSTLAPWSHAVRLLVLILVVVPIVALARRLWFSRKGRIDTGATSDHVRGWLVAKVALVVAALAVQTALEQWMSRSASAEVVGVLLFVTVAGVGPMVHDHLVAGWRRPVRGTTAAGPADA